MFEIAGSSPLARGLRDVKVDRQCGARIIPARAGFTINSRAPGKGNEDHPRSRGVYMVTITSRRDAEGSSPLARGLPCRRRRLTRPRRIIPARAGFTSRKAARQAAGRDHPRSRGVYFTSKLSAAWLRGSSPLARGLPRRPGGRVGGFLDHPRSRGVYTCSCGAATMPRGSSPLARGLPGPATRISGKWGIIPARAGFTAVGCRTEFESRDHPRSRGVYPDARSWVSRGPGSSPLARGLPSGPRPVDGGLRIIPARAGFTCLCFVRTFVRRDHPRSRGVYAGGR